MAPKAGVHKSMGRGINTSWRLREVSMSKREPDWRRFVWEPACIPQNVLIQCAPLEVSLRIRDCSRDPQARSAREFTSPSVDWPLPSNSWEMVCQYPSSLTFQVGGAWSLCLWCFLKFLHRIELQLPSRITAFITYTLLPASLPQSLIGASWDPLPKILLALESSFPNMLLGKFKLR